MTGLMFAVWAVLQVRKHCTGSIEHPAANQVRLNHYGKDESHPNRETQVEDQSNTKLAQNISTTVGNMLRNFHEHSLLPNVYD